MQLIKINSNYKKIENVSHFKRKLKVFIYSLHFATQTFTYLVSKSFVF